MIYLAVFTLSQLIIFAFVLFIDRRISKNERDFNQFRKITNDAISNARHSLISVHSQIDKKPLPPGPIRPQGTAIEVFEQMNGITTLKE